MSLYSYVVDAVEKGSKFNVDFKKRTVTVNKKVVEIDDDIGWNKMPTELAIGTIEELYDKYKRSVPSERNDGRRRRYFKALSDRELTDDELINGEPREVSQARLEMFVLCCILNGSLDGLCDGWFWKSANDGDLIILKEWIE